MQVRDLPLGQGDDLHAGERHALEDVSDVLLVAADAIEGFRQHHLEAVAQSVRKQRLDAGPDERGAGHGPVVIALGHHPALLLGVDPAQAQLVLDRGLALLIGGIAGIERDAEHGPSLTPSPSSPAIAGQVRG